MAYLTLNDYKTYIQGDYLRQLTQGNDDKRKTEENVSVQAIVQRLTQKYNLDLEFTDIAPYDRTKVYNAAQRVTIDIATNGFQLWVASTAYVVGDIVIEAGLGYICTTINNDSVFTPSKWTSLGQQFSIFYAAYPNSCTLGGLPNPATLTDPFAPVFNYKNLYTKGDVVFWKNNTYVCNQDSTLITHQAELQFSLYGNIPFNNVFPDDQVQNAQGQYWKDRASFVVTTDTPLNNDAWIAGDNRNQTIKDAMIRITVFKLSPLIAPKNVPSVWLDDYRSMLRELNDAAEGKINMLLPLKQPSQGRRTYFGGYVKNINVT